MQKILINKLLEHLDVNIIIKDIEPTYNPKKKNKQDNISCVFASDRHDSGHDHSKSMTIGTDGKVYCHACGYKATNIIWFFKDIIQANTFEESAEYLIDKYIEPLVDSVDVRAAHTKLLHSPVMIERLKLLRGISKETITQYKLGLYKDRITIPVVNEYGYCCNIRLYDLLGLQKVKILSFKEGYGTTKLFPYEVFDKVGDIYLFEGEMDCLLAKQMGLNAVTTTGGANTWKAEWDEYFVKRNVIIVPDIDKPGQEGCAKRAKALSVVAKSVKIINLPFTRKDNKDFTDYIIKEKHSIKDFMALPRIDYDMNAQPEEEEEEEEQLDIKMSANEITYLKNADYVFESFKLSGAFFKNQHHQLYFAKNNGEVFELREKNQKFLSDLVSISPAVNPATSNGKFIIQHVKNKGYAIAKDVVTGSWCTYYNNALYLFVNGFTGKILKFTSKGYEEIDNGINEEGILLEYPEMIDKIDESKETTAEAFNKLKKYVYDNLAMSDENRFQFIIWLLVTFFRNLVNARPIVRLEASTAHGKSSATKIASMLLFGQEFLQHASTLASIYTVAAKYPLLMFDNIETRNMTNDFQDFLLIAATGGSRIKRQLHTDTGFIAETADCMVLTNGIEPYVKNEIISRTLMIKVDNEKYGKLGFNLSDVLYKIGAERSNILFPILKYLIPYVLKNKHKISAYSRTFGKHSKERFNEYYGLAKVILEGVWPYFNIKGHSVNSIMDSWLSKQNKESIIQSISVNDVLYFLNTFALRQKTIVDINTKVTEADGIIKIRGQLIQLLSDFRLLAKQLGMRCPWESHRHLSARMADSMKILERDGWRILKLKSGGKHVYNFIKEKKSFAISEEGNKKKKIRTH